MSNLLSGLDKFGLGNLKDIDLFTDEKEKKKTVGEEKKPEITEADLLFDKSYTCPVCEKEFKAKTVKIGKAKLTEVEMDLRPRYQNVDSLKYDAITCTNCGYAALSRFFSFVTSPQIKLIKETISSNYKPKEIKRDIYTYDEAIENHKLALVNAVVKKARASEKAYICLKIAWILRGKMESLSKDTENYAEVIKKCQEEETECLKNAYEGFKTAIATEPYPMCGMDETTVDYLIAVLAIKTKDYDTASKQISSIITSRTTNKRMKEKAIDLKEELIRRIKENR